MARVSPGTTFEPVELPTGRQTLPGWVQGVSVHWMRGYGNAPHVTVKVPKYDKAAGEYPAGIWDNDPKWAWDQVYVEERPGFYVARHEDGRVHHLWHEPFERLRPGVVSVTPGWAWISWRVPYKVYEGPEGFRALADDIGFNGAECVPLFHERRCLVSGLSDGFGGTAYDIVVLRDSARHDVRLNGPWHTGAPEGCIEVVGSDSGALCLTEDLLLRIISAHAPHLRVFRVESKGHVPRLEVAHGSWDCPKRWLPRDHPVHDRSPFKNEYSY